MRELLPDSVVCVETYGDARPDGASLHPEEAVVAARFADRRRREFAAVRACARSAMATLGLPAHPVLPGERGAPSWPTGVVGSMTHCDGYRAAALARSEELASLGIDAEPHRPLPQGVLRLVSLPSERSRLAELAVREPAIHWDRLLFSAKESVYKAWFPLTGRWLDFSEADIEVGGDLTRAASGHFRARLLVPPPVVDGRPRGCFEGRWTVRQGLVASAVVVPHR
ncbi:4'-phosphopantetheinyl transferase family protein [Cellulomonas xiejunii]|uniref:4'-phosphopantetheinyl transferase superfamily protein n=1 Tax=Cellulomonas xiejunii TaxID=2968083 RepID=A0ABY5KN61_9CELL|nr:4'-phosphopantetheinyl transferase superfamily protein [Cellulomonas xiejunii]MCC2321223.1 4'-phosphopantetheinyl transferase superfamily protein [Cellulomonas xiejunii]UUI71810.1 4'-phosphopantetheinyl transferase superfamily protein [Cellulomonas xiejunii]